MDPAWNLVELLAYIFLCRAVMRCFNGEVREILLALLNLGGLYLFLFYGRNQNYNARFVAYLVIVSVQYVALRLFARRQGWLPWIAFMAPIGALVLIRFVPYQLYVALGQALHLNWRAAPAMVGISYLAFRCSRLALEVRNTETPMPGLCAYLNFSFFLPVMVLGPISTYEEYRRGFAPERYDVPIGRAALRILVGAVKYLFLGGLCSQLAYGNLLLDNHPHLWIDVPIAVVFYYLFLYCNFSGFCDMAIGAAAIIGIPVPENFDNPFAARNLQEFWNRWHITLSQYMRDIVFAPLSKYLVRAGGPSFAIHAIAISIAVVFLLVGIWHGAGWNYLAFGAIHAIGLVINHYYSNALKKRLGREGYKKYMANPWIHAAAVTLTFCYVATALGFFANTFEQLHQISSMLR